MQLRLFFAMLFPAFALAQSSEIVEPVPPPAFKAPAPAPASVVSRILAMIGTRDPDLTVLCTKKDAEENKALSPVGKLHIYFDGACLGEFGNSLCEITDETVKGSAEWYGNFLLNRATLKLSLTSSVGDAHYDCKKVLP